MSSDKTYSLERQQAGMFLARDANGNRIGIISGKAGHWRAERMNGSTLSCYNTRHDAATALVSVAGFK